MRNAGAGNCATCYKTRRAALRRSDGRFGASAHSSLRCSIRQDPIAWFIPQSARNYYRGRSIIDDAFARTRAAAAAAALRLFVCCAVMKLLRRDAAASSNARPLFIFYHVLLYAICPPYCVFMYCCAVYGPGCQGRAVYGSWFVVFVRKVLPIFTTRYNYEVILFYTTHNLEIHLTSFVYRFF